jgi:heat shock protein HtpX
VYEQIAANKRKTVLLVLGALVLFGIVGYVIGALYLTSGWVGLAIALAIAAAMSIASYRYGDRLVLASTRAKAVSPEAEPRLHNIVEGISIAAGVPKPAMYLVPEQAPNAFAT